ncbi:S41 family peptidase, partial [Candidatus Saccharibacteria bacterium]|nr:S41 family peptidase [Candidatus Saccharibacteria bacterium]
SWTPDKAVDQIRGPSGSTVKLAILRDGATQEFSITRARITNPSVRSEIVDGIGYLRISRFGDDTASLTEQAATQFKEANVKGIILDLRGNGGGYVDSAQAIASLWLKPGSVVVQERRGDRVFDTLKASGDPTLLDVPTVVLIDGGSASASEIVAGALRDNGAAKLVGEESYGKGSVQELLTLRSGAGLKVTVAKWYTPKGSNINGDGLSPDVEVSMTAEQFDAGDDTQRAAAVDILRK